MNGDKMDAPRTIADELELGRELSAALLDAEDLETLYDQAEAVYVPPTVYSPNAASTDTLLAMARIVNLVTPDRLRRYTYMGKSKTYRIIAEADYEALECVPESQRTDVGTSLTSHEI